jgi:putative nucleotidyltransferase with HDIG domain
LAIASRILLINDDEPISRHLGEKLINEQGHNVVFEYTAQAGLEALKQGSFDVVIAKFDMPDSDGVALVKSIKKISPDCIVIAFLEEENPLILKELSILGVYDFISKPVDLSRLLLLIDKGMELRVSVTAQRKLQQSFGEQNASLQKQNTLLAKRIEDSTKNLTRLYEDLRTTYMRTITALAQAIDARDHYTHSHSENVAKYAVALSEELGLSAKEIETIREACELHDIGKIGIEDSILGKPSPLTAEEWEQIKRHPITGAQILEPLTFLNDVIDFVRQHHEHFDGTGYPEGRSGEDILLGARIIHIADAYESMRSARSYRKIPLTQEEAIAEIKRHTGTQFDPKLAEVFLRIVYKL